MFMSSIGVLSSVAVFARLLSFAVGISVALASDCPPVTFDRQEAQHHLDEVVQIEQRNMRDKDFAKALIDFKEATCLVPQDARIFYGLGSTQAALGDFLLARKSFTTADQLQPADPLSLTMLVRVNVAMHDIDSLKATLLAIGTRFAGNAELHAPLAAQFLMENKLPDLALAESLQLKPRGFRRWAIGIGSGNSRKHRRRIRGRHPQCCSPGKPAKSVPRHASFRRRGRRSKL